MDGLWYGGLPFSFIHTHPSLEVAQRTLLSLATISLFTATHINVYSIFWFSLLIFLSLNAYMPALSLRHCSH